MSPVTAVAAAEISSTGGPAGIAHVQMPVYPFPAPFCLTCSFQVRPSPEVSVTVMVVTPAPPLDATSRTSRSPAAGVTDADVAAVAATYPDADDDSTDGDDLISAATAEIPVLAEDPSVCGVPPDADVPENGPYRSPAPEGVS